MNRAVMPITDYENACDKIREKTETTDLIKSGELPEKIDEVYEAGQKTEYDSFWDAYQDYGKRKYYYSGFAGVNGASYGWNDVTFKPKYDIILDSGNHDNTLMFEYSPITNIKKSLEDCGVTMDFSKATWLNAPFRGAKTTHLPPIDVSSCTDIKMAFYNMPNLKALEIRNLNANCVFDRPMTFCYALEELRITGTIGNNGIDVQCSPLTKESLLSVINRLKDFREITTITTKVTSTKPITITNGTLEEGERYTWSYYDSNHPGWVTDDAASYPTSEEVEITSTAGKVVVNGKEYTGFKASYTNYVNTPHIAGGYKIYVYQDGNEIKTVAHKGMVGDDIINLKLVTGMPTETHSIVLGTTNLAKLTDAEKAVATQKGWTLL